MNKLENNAYFWQKLDTLLHSSELTIEQPKGSHHKEHAHIVYPVDYGYLKDMMDESVSIGIYRGTAKGKGIHAIAVTADILKKDCEMKIISNCTDEEVNTILLFLNQTDFQKAIYVERGDETPYWAQTN